MDYRGQHKAPNRNNGCPLYDLTLNGIYPDDVYGTNGYRYYGCGMSLDKKIFELINDYRDKPDRNITIYRAIPKKTSDIINILDWVTINEQYAKDHGKYLTGGAKIIKKIVKASDIYTNGDSIYEWGYDPR